MVRFLLGVALLVGLLVAFFYVTRWLELRRLRKICPTCRGALDAILVDNIQLLCPDHRRRLRRIEQLERDELS